MKYKVRYAPIFHLLNIKEEFKSILDGTEIEKLSELQRATMLIFFRSSKLVASILILCNQRYIEDAAILTRSLYENDLTLGYIIKEDCPERYLKWLPIAEMNRSNAFSKFVYCSPSPMKRLMSRIFLL
jgi:hypothetical protein